MTRTSRSLLLWTPRILGILVALFIGLFALDAVKEGLVPFLIHLAPALGLLMIVSVAWRWEWVGGVLFVGLAALYAANAWDRLDWILTIAGPLFVVGLLFLWSWRHHRELHGGG